MSYADLRLGRQSLPRAEYLVTTVVAHREPLFSRLDLARCFVAVLRESEAELQLRWLAWVLMPDHFHGLLALNGATCLDEAMRTLKGRSARRLNARIGRVGPLWQPAFHDHALRAGEDRKSVACYIIANPVRAGLVDRVMDYPHWDCEWADELAAM